MTDHAVIEPLGPPALPLLGHAPAFLRDKLGFLERCAAKYGDVVRLDIGGATYLLTSPDDIKHVLLSNATNYEKTARLTGARGRRFFGNGLVTAAGAAHLRHRRMLQPLFHHAVVERLASVVAVHADAMLGGWTSGAELDVHDAMLDLTQRITTHQLLGDEDPAVLDRFRRAVSTRRSYQEYLLGTPLPFIDRLPTRAQRDYARAHRELDEIVNAGIARRRAEARSSGDLLALLVHARYDDGQGLTDEQIRDEMRTLSVAGYETVAEALTWAWYLLAGADDVASMLWEEADGAAPPTRSLSSADAARLPWCRMVLAESMRLYPPTWLFARVAQGNDMLPSGVRVAAGCKIYLSQWVMHRHPRYFAEPARFDPRRFTPEAMKSRPALAYFPFGAGRRLCIGQELAWMQGVLILATVARRFRLALAPGQLVVPEPNVTLRPRGGLRMRVLAR